MRRYYVRLDDAHAKMDIKKWKRVISILDNFGVKAIIGVIPNNKDSEIDVLEYSINFWNVVKEWNENGHIIALHGLNHLKHTTNPGLIPKNKRSEFAGLDIELQTKKIAKGIEYFKENGFEVKIFIPPFHSFDRNTIVALLKYNIDVLYDGISFYPYEKDKILFFPQQYNKFKKRRKGCWTTCLHPSSMTSLNFKDMETFISENKHDFHNDFFETVKKYRNRKVTFKDMIFYKIYFLRRQIYFLKKRILYAEH